jgi:hypothetical protein
MAVEAPLLSRQRIFAAKVETTTGTAIALAAADALFNVYDPELKPDIEMTERPGQSALSPLPSVQGAIAATYTFKTDLTGQGASSPTDSSAATLWPACGFSKAGGVLTVQTGSSSYQSLTMGHYNDGRFFSMCGAVGKVKLPFRPGQIVRPEWEFKGAWVAPTDVALITPTYPTIIPPRFASATVTLGGANYKFSELDIEIENELTMREDATKASGIHSFCITNRRIKVTLDPEAALFATKDFYADWAAGTQAALAITLGSVTHNTVSIAMPKLQVTKCELGDRNGILVDKLEMQSNRNAAAGDDEMVITFS